MTDFDQWLTYYTDRFARMGADPLKSADYGTPMPRTPDGAPYSASAIYHAMSGWEA